jgi:thymidine kinase
MEMEGYLELYFGSMYSGKTTELIKIFRTYEYIGKTVAVINYIGDVRYHNTLLSTHDKIMIPCISTKTMNEIWNDPTNPDYEKTRAADVILINEGQFFTDLFPIVLEMVETHHKHVYIFGLDGDFQRKKFGQMLDLVPYSDKVSKLQSLCSICKNGTKGIFSHRISTEETQIVIGNDNYKPLCRKCYLENTSKK